ncbi:MAG TPA: hypothetical protein VHS78_19360 [Candidatus Elarobacter sp.]|jgi:hypothetical protein|nr:hypothetical protein [Candidatus Elarobacter sp.]
MAGYKLTDDYGAKYPSLANSILSVLVFSDHALTGSSFTGTLDVGASGAALETVGLLFGTESIPVSGTVTDTGSTLTVALGSTSGAAFAAAVAAKIPLIGPNVTQSAGLTVNTVATTGDDPDAGPATDEIDLTLTLLIAGHPLTITSRLPMHGGFAIVNGSFTGIGIELSDLGFLLGSDSSAWFPSSDLGAFYQSGTALELIALSITLYFTLDPFAVSVSSISVTIGIVKIPLVSGKIYVNPLAVVVTVAPGGDPPPSYSLEGTAVLCNYQNPNPDDPDFAFEIALGITGSSPNRTFQLSGLFENPYAKPVSALIQDMVGAGTDTGISSSVTLEKFDFTADIVQQSGSLTDFTADLAMQLVGAFGVLSTFELESFSVSVAYSA